MLLAGHIGRQFYRLPLLFKGLPLLIGGPYGSLTRALSQTTRRANVTLMNHIGGLSGVRTQARSLKRRVLFHLAKSPYGGRYWDCTSEVPFCRRVRYYSANLPKKVSFTSPFSLAYRNHFVKSMLLGEETPPYIYLSF